MGISEQEKRGSTYCTSCALRVNCGDSMHVVLFLKKRDSYCEKQQWGARLLSPPAEGGATWQSSFEIPPQSDIYSISHRQHAVIKMCQTVVRVLLDFFFFFFLYLFFFLWFRSLHWGSFKCETISVGGDGENRPPPACQKTLLLLPTN